MLVIIFTWSIINLQFQSFSKLVVTCKSDALSLLHARNARSAVVPLYCKD